MKERDGRLFHPGVILYLDFFTFWLSPMLFSLLFWLFYLRLSVCFIYLLQFCQFQLLRSSLQTLPGLPKHLPPPLPPLKYPNCYYNPLSRADPIKRGSSFNESGAPRDKVLNSLGLTGGS